MKGLWLLPSRRRLAKLQAFFDSAVSADMTTGGVVLVQKDELTELRLQYDALKMPQGWSILPTNSEGLGNKCREVWPAVSKLDWIGLACDDLRPQTKGWDMTLLARLNGRNVVSCNDGQQGNARMAGITVFSGGLLRAMGYMFPPGFWHTYTDNAWEDIGRGAECWTYEPDVLILHDHPFVNQAIDPAKADDTTRSSYGHQAQDAEAYRVWCLTDREAVIRRVKALGAA